MTVARPGLVSRRCTSMTPGWLARISRSRSTTGGVHRATDIETVTGVSATAEMSGSDTSIAWSCMVSSRRRTRPRMTTTWTSASTVE